MGGRTSFFDALDEKISYKTIKYVDVKDWRLGFIHLAAMMAILLYVLGRTILYNNEHLAVNPVFGSVRLTVQQPTKDCNPLKRGCESDFGQLSKSRYCSNYTGKDAANLQLPCVRLDGIDMTNKAATPGTFFIPTRFTTFEQRRSNNCGDTCGNVWEFDESSEISHYVHDVSRFTLLVDHGYFTIGSVGEVTTSSSADAHAFMESSKVASHPLLQSKRKEADYLILGKATGKESNSLCRLSKHDKSNEQLCSAFPSSASFTFGDMISLGDLLKLADPLAREGEELLDLPFAGKTLRHKGAVLLVVIQYMNQQSFDPFGKAPIRYVISSSLMPITEYKCMYKEADGNEKRYVQNVHGLLIEARVQGKIRRFSLQNFLMTLTTAMALVAISTVITDAIMTYGLADSDKFSILKYQPTQHFKEMRELQEAMKHEKGESYDELENKPTPTADFLSDIFKSADTKEKSRREKMNEYHEKLDAASKKSYKDGESSWLLDSMAVMVRHEQRLNRLDAMDEHNLGRSSAHKERMARFYRDWEDEYWDRQGCGDKVREALMLKSATTITFPDNPGYMPLHVETVDE